MSGLSGTETAKKRSHTNVHVQASYSLYIKYINAVSGISVFRIAHSNRYLTRHRQTVPECDGSSYSLLSLKMKLTIFMGLMVDIACL